jgi:hypothetical protein
VLVELGKKGIVLLVVGSVTTLKKDITEILVEMVYLSIFLVVFEFIILHHTKYRKKKL